MVDKHVRTTLHVLILTLGSVLCTYHAWDHRVRSIPGTYEGRARDLLTFVTKCLVPIGLFDCFALLRAGSLRKDPRDSFYIFLL